MTRPARVTALVDSSAYADGVAEHGAWLAERLAGRLQLRHVREGGEDALVGRRLLESLARRLGDQGLPVPELSLVEGGVLAAAVGAEADLLVMGKRGVSHQGDRAALGGHVDAVVRAATTPVCLTSQVFLPIPRVVAVTDADPSRRAAVDLVARQAGFADLDLDVIVAVGPGREAEAKLGLTRQALEGRAAAFPIHAERLGEAVWRYLDDRPADLIVISREVLFGDENRPLGAVSPQSFWMARASVLVC